MGNNNAYCQDNELSWCDWNLDDRRRELLEFTRHLIKIRRDHPVLRRRKFFHGRPIRGKGVKDIMWLRPDGKEMTDEDWDSSWIHCLGMLLIGQVQDEVDENGVSLNDDAFFVILNAYHEPISFTVPTPLTGIKWEVIVDTSASKKGTKKRLVDGGQTVEVSGRSAVLLKQIR